MRDTSAASHVIARFSAQTSFSLNDRDSSLLLHILFTKCQSMTVGQAMYNYASLAIKRGVVDARCEALHAALYYLPEQISNLVIGEPIKNRSGFIKAGATSGCPF